MPSTETRLIGLAGQQSTIEGSSIISQTSRKIVDQQRKQSLAAVRPPGIIDITVINNLHQKLGIDELNKIRERFVNGQPVNSKAGSGVATVGHCPGMSGQDSVEAVSRCSFVSEKNEGIINHNNEDEAKTVLSESKRPPQSMNKDEWLSTINDMFGRSHGLTEAAVAMFRQMDARGSGFVVWNDLLDVLIGNMKPNSLHVSAKHLSHSGRFKSIQHAKRETIQKVIAVATGGGAHVFIIVSKYGHVGIYDDKFRLQRQYDVDIDTDPNANLDVAASDPGWITDGIWMDNSKHAVYATSLRTMHFFDASASVHYEEYRAFGLRSIPTCVDFYYDEDNPDGEALLIFGDDSGGLTTVTFHQPLNSLFAKDEVDNVQCLFWPDMSKHSEYATISYAANLHKDGILGLQYLSHNNTVITISRDANASVLIRHLHNKFDTYVFKLGWGVRCFDFRVVNTRHILVTGSNDKLIRIWNPVVPANPCAVLIGHQVGIIDVKVYAEKELIFSYDKRSVIKVWSLDQTNCLQTLTLQFPSYKILGREIEFGRPAFYLDTGSSDVIIATCCEHLTVVNLKEGDDVASETGSYESFDQMDEEAALITEADRSRHFDDTEKAENVISGLCTPEMRQNSMADVEANRISSLPQASRDLLQSPTGSQSSDSSIWSGIVRNTMELRSRGKIFQKRELENQSVGYTRYRLFHERKTNLDEYSLNVLRVRKYSNNTRMKELAKDNMPFMGIEIHGMQEIKLDENLPHSHKMRAKGINICTVDDLLGTKFDRLGIGGGAQSPIDPDLVLDAGESLCGSSIASRRSSTIYKLPKSARRGEFASPATVVLPSHRRRSSTAAEITSKTLPMIAEKSDTQSVTETSSRD